MSEFASTPEKQQIESTPGKQQVEPKQEEQKLEPPFKKPRIEQGDGTIHVNPKWLELSAEEQFKRVAWAIATSTALETCESPQEIFMRIMAQHQQTKATEQGKNEM